MFDNSFITRAFEKTVMVNEVKRKKLLDIKNIWKWCQWFWCNFRSKFHLCLRISRFFQAIKVFLYVKGYYVMIGSWWEKKVREKINVKLTQCSLRYGVYQLGRSAKFDAFVNNEETKKKIVRKSCFFFKSFTILMIRKHDYLEDCKEKWAFWFVLLW